MSYGKTGRRGGWARRVKRRRPVEPFKSRGNKSIGGRGSVDSYLVSTNKETLLTRRTSRKTESWGFQHFGRSTLCGSVLGNRVTRCGWIWEGVEDRRFILKKKKLLLCPVIITNVLLIPLFNSDDVCLVLVTNRTPLWRTGWSWFFQKYFCQNEGRKEKET